MLEQCPRCFDHFGQTASRQQMIVHLLGHGIARAEIGALLDISEQNVGAYITRYKLKRPRADLLVNPETRDILAENGLL